MLKYDWKFCEACNAETHHTFLSGKAICNACHTTEEVKTWLTSLTKTNSYHSKD